MSNRTDRPHRRFVLPGLIWSLLLVAFWPVGKGAKFRVWLPARRPR